MSHFDSARAFANFQDHVMRQSRYILGETSQRFLDSVIATSKSRDLTVPEGSNYWRAQRGHDWQTIQQGHDEFEVPGPHPGRKMRPRTDRAMEGRVNPKGIPCLYVATDRDTAMAETRPTIGSFVSVGQFKTLRELKILDCSIGHASGITIFLNDPSDQEIEKAVWNDIDRAFSTPIQNGDSSANYAPTQYLSDLFKNEGFDGVAYKSNLGDGFNVALFDVDSADLINCFLFQVKSVQFEFNETANPYFVSKYYEAKSQSKTS